MAAELSQIRPVHLQRRRVRWFFAGLLVAIGAIDVVEAFVVHHTLRDRVLEAMLPTTITEGSRTAVVISGLALLLLARGMAAGKRAAWLLTCLVLGASAALHLVKDLDVEQAALAAWILLGLWWLRADFQAASDPAALKRGAIVMGLGGLLVVLEAEAGALLLHNQLSPRFGPIRSLEQLVLPYVGGSAYQPRTERAAWFLGSLPWVSGALLLVGLVELLRPVAARAGSTDEERQRARRVLRRWGRNPVAWLALAAGNCFCWATDNCFVAYRVSGRVALALGDPVGPPAELEAAVDGFIELCERRGWTPAFYQTETDAPYRARGQTVIKVGLDAIVETGCFSLAGSDRADLRYAVRRCERQGVAFGFQRGDEAWEAAAVQLRDVSARWLGNQRESELGFSVGQLESLDDEAVTVAMARTADGRLAAFASWLPVPKRKGWTLDLMRRRPDAPYGVMEALIAASLAEAQRRGLKQVSLGLVTDVEGSRLSPRLNRNRSLQRFKEKFGPRWEPRYLVVPDRGSLAAALAALARVHLPALPALSSLHASLRHLLRSPARKARFNVA